MMPNADKLYVPTLRMKWGELRGLADLAPEVADRILPRLIVPPPGERDEVVQGALFPGTRAPDITAALSWSWHGRPALIDTTYMARNPGLENIGGWLPGMFFRARCSGFPVIPLVRLGDLDDAAMAAYSMSLAPGPIALSVLATPDEVDGAEALDALRRRLNLMQAEPSTCALIIDFSGYDLSSPEIVGPIASDAITRLLAAAVWGQLVFQGTNFPETNRAPAGGCLIVDRNEWRVWQAIVEDDPAIAMRVLFGDYAADCSKMKFDKGGRPIPHLRYTTSQSWRLERGADGLRQETALRDICRRIVNSRDFSGESFSSADARIASIASYGADTGGPRDWRAMNTTHHLTHVIAELGQRRGFELQRRISAPRLKQSSFLD